MHATTIFMADQKYMAATRRMHLVSAFMQIQKLWQVLRVFIAYTQILDDIFVFIACAQKLDVSYHTEHKSLYKVA
jgi:hypothetical protein